MEIEKEIEYINMIYTHAMEVVERLRKYGFNPIAVTTMICEHTFAFETQEEALNAFNKMEKENNGEDCVQGWFYDWKDFLEALDDYKKQFGYINDVFWVK